MFVKPTLTDKLLQVNSALKPIFFVIEVQSGEDSISKQAHVKLVNKQPSDFRFDHVLRCLREPILDFLKMFIGSSDHYEYSRGRMKFIQASKCE